MKINFLLYNAYGIGGTIRSTANLSAALAEAGHTVEVVSVYRTQDVPQLRWSPRVVQRALIDWRHDSPTSDRTHAALDEPSAMFPDTGVQHGPLAPTRLTDERVSHYLAETDADVVIGTRPVLNGYLAVHGKSRYLRVGQEHLTFEMHGDRLRADQNETLARLDAFVTVSEADASRYRAALPEVGTRILCIPNCTPRPDVAPSTGDSRTIVAAGRLISVKRYDRLINAFAKIAPRHPDWSLRLYGRGPKRAELRDRIAELGMHDRIRLMGAASPIETEWAKGAIAAVTSDAESFGLTIVEAMHCGVPVVATDCPHGPGEIITHGHDGLLTPLDRDADGVADALEELIENPGQRAALAAATRETAAGYAPDRIADRYLTLFGDLRRTLRTSRTFRTPRRSRTSPAPRASGGSGASGTSGTSGTRLTGLLGRLARRGPAAPPAGPGPTPQADVRVTADGGIRFHLRADDSGTPPGNPAELLLRLRSDPARQHLRIPVDADGTALLARDTHLLAEGRWDLNLPAGRTTPRRRVASGLVEQAALLSLPLGTDTEGRTTAWIPYTTSEGNLSIRTWARAGHAELTDVRADSAGAVLTVAVHGADVTGDASVLARLRGGDGTSAVDRPRVRVPAYAGSDGLLAAHLPHHLFTSRRSGGEQDIWDLFLVPAEGAAPVRVARLAEDIHERGKTDRIPPVHVTAGGSDAGSGSRSDAGSADGPEDGSGGGSDGSRTEPVRMRISPYFTFDNGLSLSVKPIPDDDEDAEPAGAGRAE